MRTAALLAIALSSLSALAAPAPAAEAEHLEARQNPQFCVKEYPAPADEVIAARHTAFANAFLVEKNIDKAFTYIAPEYINHNPFAQNGAQYAYNLLKPIWASQNIRVIRTLYGNLTSRLNYQGSYGTIIDRYRWENGCIVEHWDAGETWPTN